MARDFSPFILNRRQAGERKYATECLSKGPEFPAEQPRELRGMSHTLSEQASPKSTAVKHSSRANFKDGGSGHPQPPATPARSPLQGSQSTTGGTTRSDGCRRHLQPPRPSGSSRGQLNFPGAPYYWGWGAAAPAAATAAGNLRPRPARPQPAAAELRQPDPLVPPPRTQPPQRERQVTVAPQGSGSRPGGRRGGLKTRVGPRRGPQAGTSPPAAPSGSPPGAAPRNYPARGASWRSSVRPISFVL